MLLLRIGAGLHIELLEIGVMLVHVPAHTRKSRVHLGVIHSALRHLWRRHGRLMLLAVLRGVMRLRER